ncbi:hypothetical protein J6590_064362 [Homalodisca vitripennis]|nr:hypothetical protein J6590_064362 [Homalodisca vitripennis]
MEKLNDVTQEVPTATLEIFPERPSNDDFKFVKNMPWVMSHNFDPSIPRKRDYVSSIVGGAVLSAHNKGGLEVTAIPVLVLRLDLKSSQSNAVVVQNVE